MRDDEAAQLRFIRTKLNALHRCKRTRGARDSRAEFERGATHSKRRRYARAHSVTPHGRPEKQARQLRRAASALTT
ncbi:hypothetical protein C6Q21_01625 [Burkholderia multivorans]|nr:hypothetical protein C6Q21_01625 [Burkholderia multivorans]